MYKVPDRVEIIKTKAISNYFNVVMINMPSSI